MALRLGVGIALLVLLACGSGESTTAGGDAGGATGASAGGSAQPDVSSAPPAATGTTPAQSCLDLVGRAEFTRALPVCIEAAKADPTNAQVQAALARARSATGSAAASAQGAAEGAAGAASDAAAGAMDDATDSAAGAMGAASGKMPGTE